VCVCVCLSLFVFVASCQFHMDSCSNTIVNISLVFSYLDNVEINNDEYQHIELEQEINVALTGIRLDDHSIGRIDECR
jgi:hypothetical protein